MSSVVLVPSAAVSVSTKLVETGTGDASVDWLDVTLGEDVVGLGPGFGLFVVVRRLLEGVIPLLWVVETTPD